jgi:hypothetical protein
MACQRFVLNAHLDMVLEDDGTTAIYVDGERFRQCMYIILSVPADIAGDCIENIMARTN